MKVLVAYDGTLQSKDALKYGIEKVKSKGGELIAMHVFNNRLFVDYDATLGAEAAARREASACIAEAENIMRNSGVKASIVTAEGIPAEELLEFAKDESVDILLCPPKYKAAVESFRATGKTALDNGFEKFTSASAKANA